MRTLETQPARAGQTVILVAMGSAAVTALLLLSAVCDGQCALRMFSLTADDAAPSKRGFAPPFYGPMEFDALPGQALNRNQTHGKPTLVGPKTSHYDANGTDFGSVQFSRAINFNGGRPLLTMGFLLADGIGVNRDIHWHTMGDEWAYVIKGKWATTMAAPTKFDPEYKDALPPWDGTYGIARKNSVWFFPANWWHTITCIDAGGCAAILFFNSPPSAEYEPNSPQLAQTVHGMPAHIAAHVLGVSEPAAAEVQHRIRGASLLNRKADYLSVSALTRTVACSQPGFVGQCPQRAMETPSDAFPAVADAKVTGNTRVFPYIRGSQQPCASGDSFPYGASLWDVTASNFPLLKLTTRVRRGGVTGPGISGQIIELAPGGTRPPVWTINADATLFVAEGFVTLWIYAGDQYNGFAPSDSHRLDNLITTQLQLGPNQAAYVPQGQVYYLQESACAKAVLTVAFNHVEWEEVDMADSLRIFADFEVDTSLNEPGMQA
jgi:oxalate decarboxylase/phosphoglucose isomerase-like protein (cupin superfamily)